LKNLEKEVFECKRAIHPRPAGWGGGQYHYYNYYNYYSLWDNIRKEKEF
jgi:hypothetical protein